MNNPSRLLRLVAAIGLAVSMTSATCAAQNNMNISTKAEPKQLTIVGYGASTMRGWRDGVTKEQTFRAVLEKGLKEQGIPAVVTDAAQPGNTSIDAMTRFERDVLNADPDIVLIDVGIGDSWIADGKTEPRVPIIAYRANLQYWVDVLKARKAKIVFITLQPMVQPKYDPRHNTQIEKYVEVQRDVAHKAQIPVIDVCQKITEMRDKGFDLNTLYLDGQHFNVEGNKFVGDMVLDFEKRTGFFSDAWKTKLNGGIDPQTGVDTQTAKGGKEPAPFNAQSFEQMGVLATWRKYAGVLSWGKSQTLAILDDGADLTVPQWKTQLPWGPKVIATHNTVEGGSDPSPRPPGYHGTTVGYPSSLNHDGVLGVAYNNQVAHVRAFTVVHLKQDESKTIAEALQWVIDNHKKYKITAVNLSPVDDKAHQEPVPTVIDEKLKTLRELNVWVSAPTANNNFTNGISWPASQPYCFAIGATLPGKREVHRDRWKNTDLLVVAPYTSSSNAYATACSMILREAIDKANYDWRKDGSTLPDAMMKIFQHTGVEIYDKATELTFKELDLLAAVDHVFANKR